MERDGRTPSPILVCGIAQRSGTHFLYDALGLHPQVAPATSTALSADPSWEDHLLTEADQLVAYVERLRARWNLDETRRSQVAAMCARALGGGLAGFLSALAVDGGATPDQRPLTKTPSLEHLDLVDDLFPDAALVVIVREPRAVVASSVASFAHSPERWMRVWKRNAQILAAFDARRPGRVTHVRYEDLVAAPAVTMRHLLGRLELDPERYDFERLARLPVRGSSALEGPGWTPVQRPVAFDPLSRGDALPARLAVRLDWLVGAEMAALGYPAGAAPNAAGRLWQRVLDARWEIAHVGSRTARAVASGAAEFARDRTRVVESAHVAAVPSGAGDMSRDRGRRSPSDGAVRRITAACLAVTTAVAVVDASDTHRVLIGLLAAGPLLAVLTRRARVTALVGLWAVALAVVLGVPDRMWATHKQAEYAGSIALVAGLSTTASAITERVTGTARIRG